MTLSRRKFVQQRAGRQRGAGGAGQSCRAGQPAHDRRRADSSLEGGVRGLEMGAGHEAPAPGAVHDRAGISMMDEAGVDRAVIVPPSWPASRRLRLEAVKRYPTASASWAASR